LWVAGEESGRIPSERRPDCEKHGLAAGLLWLDQVCRVGKIAAIHDVYFAKRTDATSGGDAGRVVSSVHERRVVEENLRTSRERYTEGRNGLEVGSLLTSGEHAQRCQLIRDVLSALEIALRPELTAHH
jgi:hypothetical protein